MVNTVSRKYQIKPNPNGSWKDIKPNFGIIRGLHLDYLEFPEKIKKSAPTIAEPTFSGKVQEDTPAPPPPATQQQPEVVEEEIYIKSTKNSPEKEGEYEESQDDELLNKFGESPKASVQKLKETDVKKIPKFIQIPTEKEKEPDPNEQIIKDEVERRQNIIALKKAKRAGIEIADEITDDMDLQTTRILRQTCDKQMAHNSSVSMNKFALAGGLFGLDQFFQIIAPQKMKGYWEYQMDIIHIYDDYLEEIGETPINAFFQDLDPSIKLGGMITTSTAAYFILQNFVGEDKLKGAKLIKSFFPKQASVIDEITDASKKQKNEKTEKPAKKRRGPTFKAEDVNVME